MAALFACTKCHSRHPFEDLSEVDQVCKTCRATNTAVKCIYCRTEFQNDNKELLSPVCKSCAKNVKQYGKPKACEYCKEMAAFVGKLCQHCTHQEKKYGAPQTCNRCKNVCAFDRGPEYKKSMGDQLLCWQCIVSHKRAKMRQREAASNSNSLLSVTSTIAKSSSHGNTPYTPPTITPEGASSEKKPSPSLGRSGIHKSHSVGDFNGSSYSYKVKTVLKHKDTSSSSNASPIKRARLDNIVSNGVVPSTNSRSGTSVVGSTSGATTSTSSSSLVTSSALEDVDQLVVVTQLRELIEAQKKQLLAKEQVIIQKEQKITELKAQHFELEKELRGRLEKLQKESESSIESLQAKNRELQKKVQSITKPSKRISAPFSNTPPI